MNKITLGEVTNTIQDLIGEITNRKKETISLILKLREAPLRFNNSGLRALTIKLNDKFIAQGLKLTNDIVQEKQTVEDLVDLVWDKITKPNKISGN